MKILEKACIGSSCAQQTAEGCAVGVLVVRTDSALLAEHDYIVCLPDPG